MTVADLHIIKTIERSIFRKQKQTTGNLRFPTYNLQDFLENSICYGIFYHALITVTTEPLLKINDSGILGNFLVYVRILSKTNKQCYFQK